MHIDTDFFNDSSIPAAILTPVHDGRSIKYVSAVVQPSTCDLLKPTKEFTDASQQSPTAASDYSESSPDNQGSNIKYRFPDPASFTEIMLARYRKSIENLPKLDKDDAVESTPLFNSSLTRPERQAHPEFSQSSYERLRSLEEKLSRVDYTLDAPKSKHGFMTAVDRTYAIQKI